MPAHASRLLITKRKAPLGAGLRPAPCSAPPLSTHVFAVIPLALTKEGSVATELSSVRYATRLK